MKYFAGLFILLIIFIINSCIKGPDNPSAILKPAQMEGIIWDMVKADAYAEVMRQKDTVNPFPKITMQLSDKVFALHHTSRLQVENSFRYYAAHPGLLKTILDSVNSRQSVKPVPVLKKPVKNFNPDKSNE